MNTAVATQLTERVTPLTLDVDAPFDDLGPLSDQGRDAEVVALGSSVRQSHELLTLTHRVMRFPVEQHGFRSLALEGDYLTRSPASCALDSELRVQTANDAYYRVFRASKEETEGQLFCELEGGQWDVAGLPQLLENVVDDHRPINDFEI